MTRELPPTLSAYLIREASRFLNYPERTGRKKIDRLVAENWEVVGHALVEWRKTFAPAHLDDALEMIHEEPQDDQADLTAPQSITTHPSLASTASGTPTMNNGIMSLTNPTDLHFCNQRPG